MKRNCAYCFDTNKFNIYFLLPSQGEKNLLSTSISVVLQTLL